MASPKDFRFYSGLALLVVGWIVSLNYYVLLFAAPVVVLGLVLIWLSAKSLATKSWLTAAPLLLWLPGVWGLLYFGSPQARPATFLIPQDFRGQITLFYNQPCGETLRTENNRLVYRIPASGILLLQAPMEEGVLNREYYFVDSQGRKTSSVPHFIQQDFNEDYTLEKNPHEPPRHVVGLFMTGSGSGSTTKISRYDFETLHVMSYDSLRRRENELADTLVDSLLIPCTSKVPASLPY
ncbi:DUF6843 domain-containing protein [Hymenobacter cellulosivorans]|uniref:DUF6843 domain-containing protein n=1 Tax=Hymenobacter cellulosivorans TaxID=2932249 RepID=A0ABY4F908_9BACT|nr:hypothetical protein [Hymenobacter cellulosivorans]UOQ52518.1 hypothetical protein MUN80_22550 [Hymenobacter cellulosivorans]